ncbi:hypothetical protein JHK82_012339 [Glycine max]|uniref:Putative mitochondrial protein n=1 Tax=Glycine soja TaxID=3848 RepID=A0A0B2PG62_GLYSO|nr:hypothetical protein JHK87_012254 [Glycine soja]KAG5040221.1 hypothetical protein JHK85_012697 [Glycine max]KAG5057361.1 hypothetical protein JHK86_012357 [Glycine max]KAG5154370.1 hypothetical protein JHK82_012339 [Glycine max]KHN08341.1 Putative mitochondrial protein [Glycine soja]
MGLKNFYGFNFALLGKQGWHFMANPKVMVAHIFKARYYLRGAFLDTDIGPNPSYSWLSICNSRIVLREGLRWKIGDKSLINVWKETWIKGATGDRFLTQFVPGSEDLAVKDLLKPDIKE